jgi:hypothetical protein
LTKRAEYLKNKEKQNIVSISGPVFDKNYENCVVPISSWKFTKVLMAYKYFLKKVYGI